MSDARQEPDPHEVLSRVILGEISLEEAANILKTSQESLALTDYVKLTVETVDQVPWKSTT